MITLNDVRLMTLMTLMMMEDGLIPHVLTARPTNIALALAPQVLFGGHTGGKDGKLVGDVHFMDLDSWSWTQPLLYGALPSPRSHAALVVIDVRARGGGGGG